MTDVNVNHKILPLNTFYFNSFINGLFKISHRSPETELQQFYKNRVNTLHQKASCKNINKHGGNLSQPNAAH